MSVKHLWADILIIILGIASCCSDWSNHNSELLQKIFLQALKMKTWYWLWICIPSQHHYYIFTLSICIPIWTTMKTQQCLKLRLIDAYLTYLKGNIKPIVSLITESMLTIHLFSCFHLETTLPEIISIQTLQHFKDHRWKYFFM